MPECVIQILRWPHCPSLNFIDSKTPTPSKGKRWLWIPQGFCAFSWFSHRPSFEQPWSVGPRLLAKALHAGSQNTPPYFLPRLFCPLHFLSTKLHVSWGGQWLASFLQALVALLWRTPPALKPTPQIHCTPEPYSSFKTLLKHRTLMNHSNDLCVVKPMTPYCSARSLWAVSCPTPWFEVSSTMFQQGLGNRLCDEREHLKSQEWLWKGFCGATNFPSPSTLCCWVTALAGLTLGGLGSKSSLPLLLFLFQGKLAEASFSVKK